MSAQFPARARSPLPLLNAGHLQEQLRALYGARFPDGSARGKTHLMIQVNAGGNATSATVARSAGNPTLDSLALAVKQMMLFVPAVDEHGLFVPDEISLTLEFPPKGE
jgi:TonB family protein